VTRTAHHEVMISDAVPGTLRGALVLYPSALATMVQGTEAMIAEPAAASSRRRAPTIPTS